MKLSVSLQYVRRLCVLISGLFLCSLGSILTYRSDMGLGPWDVFHKGLSLHTPLSFGQAAIAVGAAIILLGLLLKVRPGVGTVLNMLLIGTFADWLLNSRWLPDFGGAPLFIRLLVNIAGVLAMGLGTAFYILPALGAGPRDGLMLRLHTLTKLRIAFVRAAIELSALTMGFFLGGTVGAGTLIFAFGVGPAVELGFWLTRRYLFWLVPARAKAEPVEISTETPLPVPLH
jgi:uncharacterized membrane protein YczE